MEEKLAIAKHFSTRFGTQLLADKKVQLLLCLLNEESSRLDQHMMVNMDLGSLCGRCSTKPGGGCCSIFMAGETDSIQLLINLLAGIKVQKVRDDGVECCYLAERGCIFRFKPMFCLNYNCSAIREEKYARLASLEQLTGVLLGHQFELEQHLLSLLRVFQNS